MKAYRHKAPPKLLCTRKSSVKHLHHIHAPSTLIICAPTTTWELATLFIYRNRLAGKVQALVAQGELKSWLAGRVEKGARRMVIEPKQLIYTSDTMAVRG